jgi:hypothetical protein
MSFAVATLDHEVDVVVCGDVRRSYRSANGETSSVDGSSVPHLLTLPHDVASVCLTISGVDASPPAGSSLTDGSVPGGGLRIQLASDVPPAVPADPATPPVWEGWLLESAPVAEIVPTPVNLLEQPDAASDADEPPPEPLPLTAVEGPDHAPLVRGVACGVGHLNRVGAAYCAACGRRLQGTVSLVEGPRPPLGTLIFDDGSTFTVRHGYIIGRSPQQDPAVNAGDAEPIPLADDDRSISRVHVEIRIDGWNVLVLDRGSANGSFVLRKDAPLWERLVPNVPSQLTDGSTVAIGRRTFVLQER